MNSDINTPSLWDAWHQPRILALIVFLLAADFALQVLAFTTFGGLFAPVIIGSLGGVCLPLYLLSRAHGFKAGPDFGLGRIPPLYAVVAVLIGLATLPPASLLAHFSVRLHPPDPQWLVLMRDNVPDSTGSIIVAFVAVTVCAPLAEEIIFRGLIHRLAARLWGAGPATIISALAFGIIHGEPWYLLGLIGVGLILALVYEATGSITACCYTHGTYNAVSLAMMIWGDPASTETAPLTRQDWALAGAGLLVLIVLGRYLWRLKRYRD